MDDPQVVSRDGGSPPAGSSWRWSGEMHGISAFLRHGDRVLHTYSSYARGTDRVDGTDNWLDLTARGRQEEWEQPPGRSDSPRMGWLRHHDRIRHIAATGGRRPAAASITPRRLLCRCDPASVATGSRSPGNDVMPHTVGGIPVEGLLAQYRDYLRSERGLAASTEPVPAA